MEIYLAARYSRYKEMQAYAKALEDAGHHVTSRWIAGDHDIKDTNRHADAERNERMAIEDMTDLTKSDVVISFTEDPKEATKKRPSKGGMHAEFGIGLALNKRMIVVGPRIHIFHWLPNIEIYDTLEDFLNDPENEEA